MEGRSVAHEAGKGKPHGKTLRMSEPAGLLRWGGRGGGPWSARWRRSVGALSFRGIGGGREEVHFVCDGGDEEAELWVRGILLVTGDVFGAVN
ncbi:hypothetical protein HPP92_021445 [Vanilla planifolia]|uniref:Uncharacterized protein n=1 Tax=Vanilla planifolia TaxID=51239 RepID=A0A835Q200_VANPL|nr:hypothetical protein HPP92_021445 [Vanilla planifolia]